MIFAWAHTGSTVSPTRETLVTSLGLRWGWVGGSAPHSPPQPPRLYLWRGEWGHVLVHCLHISGALSTWLWGTEAKKAQWHAPFRSTAVPTLQINSQDIPLTLPHPPQPEIPPPVRTGKHNYRTLQKTSTDQSLESWVCWDQFINVLYSHWKFAGIVCRVRIKLDASLPCCASSILCIR